MNKSPRQRHVAVAARLRRPVFLPLLIGVALISIAALSANNALANTPTIRLFPTTVVEDLKQTGNVARDMETGLQEVIGKLDQQQALYVELSLIHI